jgi:hypothetical protein
VTDSRRSPNWLLLVWLIVLSFGPANAQGRQEQAKPDQNRALNQGQQIATAVSTVTSTAISPLFGVCLIGVYQYVRTPQSERAALPFYSKPAFWISISIVLILVFLKDTIGGAVPLLKKPLDALEVLVLNKASLVLIAFPVMVHEVASLTGVQITELFTALEPVAYAADFSSAWPSAGHIAAAGVALVAGVIVTFVMWVTGHVLDVLCLLSPFPLVDLLLKGFRNAVVVALAVITVLSPRVGLAASLVLIAIGLLLFSKALRLSLMGSFFAWDLLRVMAFGHHATPAKDGVVGFSVGKVAGLPKHTLGRLTCGENGDLEFRYRILGFGPHRRQSLEKANGYRIGCGILYPSVLLSIHDRTWLQFRLLPRYKGVEDEVRIALGAGQVQDLLLQKGWRKFLNWSEAQMGASRGAAN